MKIIDPFDLRQLSRIGVANLNVKFLTWTINGIKWYKLYRNYLEH